MFFGTPCTIPCCDNGAKKTPRKGGLQRNKMFDE